MIVKRKLGLYGMIAAAHGIMIWFYQIPFPNPLNIQQPLPTSPVMMAAGTDWDSALHNHPLARDPLLLVRAHEKGFTGGLWNKSFESPNPHNDWEESPRYLDQPGIQWGNSLVQHLENESRKLWKPLTKPTGKLETSASKLVPLHRISKFRFSPNLQDRIPNILPELPFLENPQPIPPTRMQLGIDSKGMIQSLRLLTPQQTESVQRELLQHAIRITKLLQFRPISTTSDPASSSILWGEVEIQWEPATPNEILKTKPKKEGEIR